MSYIKVSQLVGEFLDLIEGGQAEYARAYRIAMRGLRRLEWDVTGDNDTCELTVECDATVCLPEDCINLVRVGVINSRGELAPLTENPNLTLSEGSRQGRVATQTAGFPERDLSTFDTVGPYNTSLGVGSYPNIGEYKYDRTNNLLILNPDFNYGTVTVVYLKRKNIDGEYLIDELSSDALVAYIDWQWHKNRAGVSPSEKAMKRSEWYNEKRLAKARIKPSTLQTLSQISRQNTFQGLKA